MDYGHTNQRSFFTEGVGDEKSDSNPDIANSLNEQEYLSREQSPQALGSAALSANNGGNFISTGHPDLETTHSAQGDEPPVPDQLGRILPMPGSPSSAPDQPDSIAHDHQLLSLSDERGHINSSKVIRAADDPNALYETVTASRNKGGDS